MRSKSLKIVLSFMVCVLSGCSYMFDLEVTVEPKQVQGDQVTISAEANSMYDIVAMNCWLVDVNKDLKGPFKMEAKKRSVLDLKVDPCEKGQYLAIVIANDAMMGLGIGKAEFEIVDCYPTTSTTTSVPPDCKLEIEVWPDEGGTTLPPPDSYFIQGCWPPTETIEAIANDGYEFSHWEGDVQGSDNPVEVEIKGFTYVEAVFTPFTTTSTIPGNHPPTIDIISPSEDKFVADCNIYFKAVVDDPEDGSDIDIVWTSDIDGVISRKKSFSTYQLSVEKHKITAIATDSQDESASAGIIIEVVRNYFSDRDDAVYSPLGSVENFKKAFSPNGHKYAREIEPDGYGLIGIFDRETDELILTINESHGGHNDLKGLAWSPDSKYIAIMFHAGLNGGVWIRDIETGELVGKGDKIGYFAHHMVFDDTGDQLIVTGGSSCSLPDFIDIIYVDKTSTTTTIVTSSTTSSTTSSIPSTSSTSSTSSTTTSAINQLPEIKVWGISDNEVIMERCIKPITFIVTDPEDGYLTGSSIRIYSDGELVGQGEYISHLDLSPGRHKITIEATDSDNGTASVSFDILVLKFYFYDREDATYSPTGSVPYGTPVCIKDLCFREIEPYNNSKLGVFNRTTGQLIITIDESHGSFNDVKALAICRTSNGDCLVAVMFHGGLNSGIWLRNAMTGELIAHMEIHEFYHYMAFDENCNLVYGFGGCLTPNVYYLNEADRIKDFQNKSGVNFPWDKYGWDAGISPYSGIPEGFHTKVARLESDFAFLASKGVKLVRIFLFCDLRTPLLYDNQGNPISFDPYVYPDMDVLVATAEKYGLRLIPVLFDYMIADGISQENGVPVGEHPELLTTKKEALLNILAQFFQRYKNNWAIYAWDIINEPEYVDARLVNEDQMKEFIRAVTDCIHAYSPGHLVTVGSRNRQDVKKYQGLGLDLYQFHYYDNMETTHPLDYPAKDLGLDKPVLIGEAQPTNIAEKLKIIYRNGYQSVLFWSLNADYDFRAVADDYNNWFLNQ